MGGYRETPPGTFQDFADHLTPLLIRRGLMQERYTEGTLREKLFGTGPYLPDSHPGRAARQNFTG